jgi:outer membrane protein assembly factor BamB
VPAGNADVSPAVADGVVVVESANGTAGPADRNAFNVVQALAAGTGRLLWSYQSPLGSFSSVGTNEEAIAGTIDHGVLLQSLPAARRFAAFDLHGGRRRWSIGTKAAVKMSAVAVAGRVYFGDTGGTFYSVAESDGTTLARQSFAAPFTCSPPVIVGRTLYVANGNFVYALPVKR